jgi:hypothetical protein
VYKISKLLRPISLILDNEKSFFSFYLIMLLEEVCSVLSFGVITNGGRRKDEGKMNTHYSRSEEKVEDIFIVLIITSDTIHNFISQLYSGYL